MDGGRSRTGGEQRGSLRSRLVFFVTLPAAVLGVSYFLFIEYVLESQGLGGHGVKIALRIGGLALIAIALTLAAACGFLLAERVTRPIRLLLRLAESGDVAAVRGMFAHHRDWEVFLLYKRVNALVTQNQSGAKNLEELESLRAGISGLRQELQRTGQHGVLAPMETPVPDPLQPIVDGLGANRTRLLAFFAELRERVARVREELAGLGVFLETPDREEGTRNGPSAPILRESVLASREREAPSVQGRLNGDALGRAQGAVERLRRVGTVLALAAERGRSPEMELGSLFDRFARDVEAMEAVLVELARDTKDERSDLRTARALALRQRYLELDECVSSLERRLEEVGEE